MQCPLFAMFENMTPFAFGLFISIFIIFLLIYYVLLVWAIVQMLQRDAHSVLLVFSFIALLPLPPFLIMGILILIIWALYKRTPVPGL